MKKSTIKVFQDIADLTKPKCASCNVSHGCCDKMFCYEAIEYAAERGIKLPYTGHESLPLMGPQGCTAPPHLRPICAVHVCEIHLIRDREFSDKYFELRDKCNEALVEEEQPWESRQDGYKNKRDRDG